nr:hypothetical protein [Rahnella aquatilis]
MPVENVVVASTTDDGNKRLKMALDNNVLLNDREPFRYSSMSECPLFNNGMFILRVSFMCYFNYQVAMNYVAGDYGFCGQVDFGDGISQRDNRQTLVLILIYIQGNLNI